MIRGIDRIRLLLVAVGGVLAGHAIALALPGAASHTHADGSLHLHDAMHGYLPVAMRWVLPIAAVALVSLMVEAMRTGATSGLVLRLVRIQTGVFVAMEIVEHIAAGVAVESLLDAPALWIGLAGQLVLSGTLAAFVGISAAAVASLTDPLERLWTLGTQRTLPDPTGGAVPRCSPLTRSISRRGPPAVARI